MGALSRTRRVRTGRLLPLLAALAVGCDGDGRTGPDPEPDPSPDVVVEDPSGDTFGTALSEGLVQPDIVRLTVTPGGEELVLVLEFAEPVVADRESPNAAAGFIDLDTDRNPATGAPAATDAFRPPGTGATGLGVDTGIIVRFDAVVLVIDIGTGEQDTLSAAYEGRRITVRLPHDRIGGDGEVNVAAVFGTLPEPTDIVPNSGHVAVQAASGARIGGTPGAASPAIDEGRAWPPAWSRW